MKALVWLKCYCWPREGRVDSSSVGTSRTMPCISLWPLARRIGAAIHGVGVGLPGGVLAEVADGDIGLVLVEAREVAEPVVDETGVYCLVVVVIKRFSITSFVVPKEQRIAMWCGLGGCNETY